MSFCGSCGKGVQEGVKFCPSCGKEIETTANVQANDAEENKGMAIIAYILFFIPLLNGDYKKSPFVKYHANQGTILFIFCIIFSIVMNILSSTLYTILGWRLWGAISSIWGVLWLAPTALVVIGILNAVNGRNKPLPMIGQFNILK